jgi:hypothetical protein
MFIENEQVKKVNTELLGVALGHLHDAGLSTRPNAGSRLLHDADLVVIGPSGEHRYTVQVRSAVTRESAAVADVPKGRSVLVVAPYVSDAVADLWRTRGIDYVDAAGNILVRWGSTLIDIRGRRRTGTRSGPQPRRAFQPRGVQVCFVLLCRPDLVGAPMRTIAAASGASLGAVKHVIDDLVDAGYVSGGRSGRRLVRSHDLFGRWVEAYAVTLSPRLWLADFSASDPYWWVTAGDAVRAASAQFGGETAAHLLDPHLQTSQAVLYARRIPQDLAVAYRWRKDEGATNVEIRRRFWSDEIGGDVVVPTPLIYADLMAAGDARLREAATRLRERDELLRRIDVQ